MKKLIVISLFASFFGFCLAGSVSAAGTSGACVISGPPVAESLVLAVMAHQHPERLTFLPWHSPDQARAYIAGGRVDGAIITTSMAATLFNRGIKVQIAGFFNTPLWIVSNEKMADAEKLSGTLVFPFGHREMPELVFEAVYGENLPGITLLHSGSAMEAVTMLRLGRAEHALLAEPAATMALLRGEKEGDTRLVKNRSLNDDWELKYPGKPLYVSTLAFLGEGGARAETVWYILENYDTTVIWIKQHFQEALAIAGEDAPMLAAQLAKQRTVFSAASLSATNEDFAAARFFLECLKQKDPRMTGGEIPEALFGEALQ